jgi:hypothetical protein
LDVLGRHGWLKVAKESNITCTRRQSQILLKRIVVAVARRQMNYNVNQEPDLWFAELLPFVTC